VKLKKSKSRIKDIGTSYFIIHPLFIIYHSSFIINRQWIVVSAALEEGSSRFFIRIRRVLVRIAVFPDYELREGEGRREAL
jgi:hypothetical protein